PGVFDLEQPSGDPPPLVLRSDQIGGGDSNIGEELFAELGSTVDLPDATDLDAGRLYVDDEDGDALVLGNIRAGTDHTEGEVGQVGAGAPGLLAVDDVVITVSDGAG